MFVTFLILLCGMIPSVISFNLANVNLPIAQPVYGPHNRPVTRIFNHIPTPSTKPTAKPISERLVKAQIARCKCHACCSSASYERLGETNYCKLVSGDKIGYYLLHIDQYDMFYNVTQFPSSHSFQQNMQCYFNDVLGKIDRNVSSVHNINDTTTHIISWIELQKIILWSNTMSIEQKILYLDLEMKHALESNDIIHAEQVLEFVFNFIAYNPIKHKPSMFTIKYAAVTFKFYFESLAKSTDVIDLMKHKFIKFYDLIIQNTEFISPDTELLLIQMLHMIDIRVVMKYFAITSQKKINIESFQYLLSELLSPHDNNTYSAVIEALINYLISNHPKKWKQNWILEYFVNDLLQYIMQYDFDLTLQLLTVAMSYDISCDLSQSFIEFDLIKYVFKLVNHYNENGEKYRDQFLAAQQIFVQNYSPDKFDPVPRQDEIEQLFIDLLEINSNSYKSWLDIIVCIQSMKNEFNVKPSQKIRKYFLNSSIKFWQYAVHQKHLHPWISVIIQEIDSWDSSQLMPEQLKKIQILKAFADGVQSKQK